MIIASINLPDRASPGQNSYTEWADRASFYERLRNRMADVPQVESVALATYSGIPPRSGERSVVDMKWSGSRKFPELLAKNRHLQLAVYAELLRQQSGSWPDVAYYVLDKAQLYATDANYFPDAQTVQKANIETTADLWKRFVETWNWRSAQMAAGQFEVALEGIEETEDSIAPDDGLAREVLKEDYNEYLTLAGWED